MSEKILCRNVVKIKFDGSSDDSKVDSTNEVQNAAATNKPRLHPSISEDNLTLRLINTNDHTYTINVPNSPLRSSNSRPPRAKQLHSVQLLVDQHNKHLSCDECQFMFLIDAEWLNAWYRCVISNDTSLYPGPINNWNLIATQGADGTLVNGTSSTSSLTLPVAAPATNAILSRASQLRGLSFDGLECDFAQELEQYQNKSPLKEALSHVPENSTEQQAQQTQLAVDYDYLTCQFPIKRELREDIDFYLLPLEAWQALHGWYGGGPPLPRHLHHSLQYRTSVHCAVGELLLQHPPPVQKQQQQDGVGEEGDVCADNVRCDGFAEGAAMHDSDLHPPSTELLPCMQDTMRHPLHTPLSSSHYMYSTLHSAGAGSSSGGGGMHRSFSSMNSLMSTTSFPSMNDLNSLSDVASTGAAASVSAAAVTVDADTDGTSLDSIKERDAGAGTIGVRSAFAGTSATSTVEPAAAVRPVAVSTTKKVGAKNTPSCHVCQRGAVTRCSKCASIYYCSRDCQLLHWKYHKMLCPKLTKRKQLLEEEAAKADPTSEGAAAGSAATGSAAAVVAVPAVLHDRAGKVGLANLGNSCYMNSSLQCLSHIKPLTLAFLSHRVFKDLNAASRDGSGGKLAEQYGKLLEELWFESARRSVSPHQLKATLGRINSEYAGLSQQDAHELIELLLDKLHEDLNRVLKKPYTNKVEWDGVAQERTVAEESWFTHGMRENSVIRDLMGSLMRYQLTCADCGKVSLSFEYHTTLQVAIPRRNTITKRVIFLPQLVKLSDLDPLLKKHPKMSTLQALLQYTSPEYYDISVDRLCSVRTLRDAVVAKLPPSHLRSSEGDVMLVESAYPAYSAVTRMLRDSLPVSKLTEEAVVFAYCPPKAAPHHVFLFQRVFDPVLEGDNISSTSNSGSSSTSSPDASPSSTAATAGTTTTSAAGTLDWKSLLRTNLTGLPLLLSYECNWTCSRLRYQALLNSLRLFRGDGALMGRAEKVFANGARSLLEQFQMADQLDLRLVDAQGTSLRSSHKAVHTSTPATGVPGRASLAEQLQDIWRGSSAVSTAPAPILEQTWTSACAAVDAKSDGISNNVEPLFGSQLPTDRTIKIEDFGNVASYQSNQNGVMFLSMDLLGGLRAEFDEPAVHKLFPAASTTTTPGATSTTAAAAKGGFTLYQCLQEHTKEEELETGNEVYCAACKEHKAARKVVRFCRAHLPQVLVLSLKRFEFRDVSGLTGFQGSAHREKIDTFIDFPIDGLDLAPFCQPDQPDDTTATAATGAPSGPAESVTVSGSGNTSTVYDLFAVCNHYGRMGFGHYTAAARDWEGPGLSSKWFAYDDNDVTPICTSEEEEAEVHSRNAYILFYRQRGSPCTID